MLAEWSYDCLEKGMSRDTVVLFGKFAGTRVPVDAVAGDFGWKVERANTLQDLRSLGIKQRVLAVFFDTAGLGVPWRTALEWVLTLVPDARAILCHGFAETADWSDMSSAGAFSSLALPLQVNEFRQCLGFIWAADSRPQRKGAAGSQQNDSPVPTAISGAYGTAG
jgi:hypothetical protein